MYLNIIKAKSGLIHVIRVGSNFGPPNLHKYLVVILVKKCYQYIGNIGESVDERLLKVFEMSWGRCLQCLLIPATNQLECQHQTHQTQSQRWQLWLCRDQFSFSVCYKATIPFESRHQQTAGGQRWQCWLYGHQSPEDGSQCFCSSPLALVWFQAPGSIFDMKQRDTICRISFYSDVHWALKLHFRPNQKVTLCPFILTYPKQWYEQKPLSAILSISSVVTFNWCIFLHRCNKLYD